MFTFQFSLVQFHEQINMSSHFKVTKNALSLLIDFKGRVIVRELDFEHYGVSLVVCPRL